MPFAALAALFCAASAVASPGEVKPPPLDCHDKFRMVGNLRLPCTLWQDERTREEAVNCAREIDDASRAFNECETTSGVLNAVLAVSGSGAVGATLMKDEVKSPAAARHWKWASIGLGTLFAATEAYDHFLKCEDRADIQSRLRSDRIAHLENAAHLVACARLAEDKTVDEAVKATRKAAEAMAADSPEQKRAFQALERRSTLGMLGAVEDWDKKLAADLGDAKAEDKAALQEKKKVAEQAKKTIQDAAAQQGEGEKTKPSDDFVPDAVACQEEVAKAGQGAGRSEPPQRKMPEAARLRDKAHEQLIDCLRLHPTPFGAVQFDDNGKAK